METVKRLLEGEFQTLKHEIEVHLGRDSVHSSGDPKKLQVESQDHEHKPEVSSVTKNHTESDHEDILQVNSGLQHADLQSEEKVKSKSVSSFTNGTVRATPAAEETHTAEETFGADDDSKKMMHKKGPGQVQVQVQERAFQVLARGAKAPTVKSGSPGQYH